MNWTQFAIGALQSLAAMLICALWIGAAMMWPTVTIPTTALCVIVMAGAIRGAGR